MEQLIVGERTDGKFYVRPITWAGIWKDGKLDTGNCTFTSDNEEECKEFVKAFYWLTNRLLTNYKDSCADLELIVEVKTMFVSKAVQERYGDTYSAEWKAKLVEKAVWSTIR